MYTNSVLQADECHCARERAAVISHIS